MSPQHLVLPLRMAGNRLAAAEQDSVVDVAGSLVLLLSTRPGERRSVPDYGTPDPVFDGARVDDLVAAAAEWEERADPALVEEVATGVVQQISVHPSEVITTSEEVE